MKTPDVGQAIDEFRDALRVYVRGDAAPVSQWFSTAEDVTLANPLGPPRRGPAEVGEGIRQGAANFEEGGSVRFAEVASRFEEISRVVTPELAYLVQIERHDGQLVTGEDITIALRVTLVFRPENGSWRVVHRHADPITTARPITTTIERAD